MALTSAAPSLRPVDRALVALSGAAGLILAILWWGSALVIRGFRLPRPQGRPDVQVILTIRPDWLLSQKGAPDALLFDSLHHYAPAVLLALFAFGLRRILRPGWPSVLPPALLLAAGISYLLVGAFPNDAGLYQDSPVRGAAGSAFVIAFPAAVVLGGVALRRSGWRGAGVWSLVAGIIMAWAVLLATALSAMAGTHQPQLSGALILQALASAWYLGMGVWLLLVSWGGVGRISDGRPALRFLRLVGAGLAVLSAAGLAGSAVLVGVSLGPTTLAQVTGRTQIATLTQGKVTRSYRVYRPAVVAAWPGLVIVLHGALGNGYQAEAGTGFDIQADRLGWIVAYPDGVADGWDTFGDEGGGWGRHRGVDDVAFIAMLIDRLEATDRLDPNRVYATGISRGGMMSYRIGCELSSRVAAIAPVSGNMATATGSALAVPCQPGRPVSVLAIHGTADPIVPLAGGRTEIIYAPLSEVLLKWRELDLCADSSAVSVSGPSTTTTWHCSQGSTVGMRVMSGGGHAWPRKGIIGSNSPDRSFDASAVIADFFLAHSRTAPALVPGAVCCDGGGRHRS